MFGPRGAGGVLRLFLFSICGFSMFVLLVPMIEAGRCKKNLSRNIQSAAHCHLFGIGKKMSSARLF